jgi:protein-disulfide isomerase
MSRAIAAFAAVLLSAVSLGVSAAPASAAAAAPLTAAVPGDMVMGSASAKVTVVEYASVVCSHCAAFNEEVFPAFKAKYIDTGKVRYVLREFPTQPVQLAAAGFLVARCAPSDKYFAVIDSLFRGQEKLFKSQDAKVYLTDAGKVGGLTEEQVQTCLQDKAKLDAFNTRVETAMETAKIAATPTFIIGDKKLEGGQSLAQLDAVLAPLLR